MKADILLLLKRENKAKKRGKGEGNRELFLRMAIGSEVIQYFHGKDWRRICDDLKSTSCQSSALLLHWWLRATVGCCRCGIYLYGKFRGCSSK
ncbi:hypothetical protein KFK09_018066 [Dendrobium nobile]|uniref:Uncharacterized protein n=1 Tax=Dendrobium nobile TaxID=94219 RepID=A0A8T3AUV6_DENNO|nr:hypothetical protein KFK09_018066 [Dendrobium nobile]